MKENEWYSLPSVLESKVYSILYLVLWKGKYFRKPGEEESEEVVEGLKHSEVIIEVKILNYTQDSTIKRARKNVNVSHKI